MPEAPQPVVPENVANNGQRLQTGARGAAGDLDLALDELNRRQDKRGEGARKGAGDVEGGEGQRGFATGETRGVEPLAAERLEYEEARRLGRGADERRADAPVQAQEAIGVERLTEAVQRALVAEGQVVGLALEADFDGVEGVLDVFANNSGNLSGMRY